MLLSGNEILELIREKGLITYKDGREFDEKHVNAASVDVTLGPVIMVEQDAEEVVDVYKRGVPTPYTSIMLGKETEYHMEPGEFILAQTNEIFNLPSDISARFILKSTAARNGLDQADAGWCDAGWNGSVLTLELRNNLRFNKIRLERDTRIGQLVFFRHKDANDKSYANLGSYNGDLTTMQGK